MNDYSFQEAWHVGEGYGEWGDKPRGPLVRLDRAHQGELMDSVIGVDPETGKDMVYHVVRCEICILTHIWPLPSQESLDLFYETLFYEKEKPDMIARYEADAEWWMTAVHSPILETCAQALGTADDAPISILDVGAGPGLLLRTAKARGWDTTAIEPSPLCAGRLTDQGHTVWCGTLGEYLACPDNTGALYDVVTLYETLEHASNPEEMLLQVYDLLRPGGVVAVVVPNDYTPGQMEACRRYKLPHWWLSAPSHCSMFTGKTLQLMLRRCGFTQVMMRGTFPLVEHFMLAKGLNYVGNDFLGRQCHMERCSLELEAVKAGRWQELEAEYTANLAQRVGREIVAVFRKE